MTEDDHDDILVQVGAVQLVELLELVRPGKRDVVVERIVAKARAIRAKHSSALGIPIQRDPRREPNTDPEATPPHPYTSGELRAAKDPNDPRSGMTTPGGIRVPRKR